MKNTSISFLLKILSLGFIILCSTLTLGQSGNISNTTLNTCDYTLFDDGGQSGDYSETNYEMTICASSGNDLYFYIDQLTLGSAFNGDTDLLVIYEGTGTTGAVLFDSEVDVAPSGILLTTNTCVTITIDTDPAFFNTSVAAGFEIVFSCTLPETCSDGILNNGEVMIDCGGVNCAPCMVPTACEPNVVDNGDFESATVVCGAAINTGYGVSNQIPRPWYDQTPATGWIGTAIRIDDNISFPSPDYQNNACTNSGANACLNDNGSLGFFTHFGGGNNREYIQTQLNTALQAGEEYCISVKVGAIRGSSVEPPSDKLGFWFHNNTYANGSGFAEYNADNGGDTFYGPGTAVNASPQVVNPAGQMFTSNCADFNYSFCPDGGETHLIIGNFTAGSSDSGSSEYISIDDLVITKSCPLTFDSDITASGAPDCLGSCVDLTANVANQAGGCEVTNDFTFQWFENGTLMAGETSALLTSVCPTVNTTYSVEITYSAGCKTMTKPANQTVITFNCGGCTPPSLIIDNLTACAPNTSDLNNAINSSSDPGNASYYNNLADANASTNQINSVVSVSGTYFIRLEDPSDASCFSVAQVEVEIGVSYDLVENGTVCSGSDYAYPDGLVSTNISANESHISNLLTLAGCDSTITTNITVQSAYNLSENINVCENSSLNYPDGTNATITANTSHVSNLISVTGCDSIITTNVTMNSEFTITENFTVCTGSDFTYPDGTISTNITADENHTSNLTSVAGCDSIITSNVVVGSAFTSTQNINICSGSDFTYPDGTQSTNITVDESYVSSFVAVGGCDSLVTTYLTVGQSYNLNESISICENSNITYPDGFSEVITANTVHTSNLLTIAGCDSVITTSVTMTVSFNTVENVTICENENYTFPDGTSTIILADLSQTSTLVSSGGCDSIIVTNITMVPATATIETVTICSGEAYTFADGTTHNGIVANESYTSIFVSINGCDSTITTNITVNNPPLINAGTDLSICEGDVITLSGSGGNSYVWDNGVINNAPFSPTTTLTFTVIGSDGAGCTATDQLTVTVNPLPTVLFAADVVSGCAPLEVTFDNLSTPAGTGCEWTIDGNILNVCGSVTTTFSNSGSYDVSLTVTSIEGCSASSTVANYIEVSDSPEAIISADTYVLDISDSEVQFYNNSINADQYQWTFGDGMNSTEVEPSHIYPSTGNSNYEVSLIATNSFGCSDEAFLNITVNDALIYYVPNAFTPDGDQLNQTFKPVFTSGYDAYDYHLLIFNRWGEIVFESYDAEYGWNGQYGSGELVEDGVYIWKLDFRETMSDKRHEEMGHVSVLK